MIAEHFTCEFRKDSRNARCRYRRVELFGYISEVTETKILSLVRSCGIRNTAPVSVTSSIAEAFEALIIYLSFQLASVSHCIF